MGFSDDLIVAADIGTTSVKAGLLDKNLSLLCSAREDLSLSHPHPDWAEQDPEEWWQALCRAVTALLNSKPTAGRRIKGLVMVAQMCGVVATGEDGTPLRPAMVWLDKRAGALMRSRIGGRPRLAGYNVIKLLRSIQLTNGAPSLNGMDPTAKMMWLESAEPEVWAKTAKLLDVKDWLLHRATGRFATTADSAHLTWMMDNRGGKAVWSAELMGRYGIPRRMLPDIVPGTEIAGGLLAKAAGELGLPVALPVVAGCGDVCAAALGSGMSGDGQLHISLGTSAWIGGFYPGRRLSVSESYATITSPVQNRPLLIATQECAGACLDWIRRVAPAIADTAPEESVGLPLFMPWLAGERVPIDDNRLRGGFLGLTLSTTTNHLVAAVREGVALNLRLAMSSVARQKGTDTAHPIPVVGGAAKDNRLCQVLADCLQRDLHRPSDPEYASLQGAAALAGTALGWQSSPAQELCDGREGDATLFKPQASLASYYDKRFLMFKDAMGRVVPWYRKFSESTHD